MGLKRGFGEALVSAASLLVPTRIPEAKAPSVFVLRNNGIGDVLLITPLLQALRELYPDGRIVTGVPACAREILIGNPNISGIMTIDAPWCNPSNTRSLLAQLQYIFTSEQSRSLQQQGFDIGIDVLGSIQGSLLLLYAGIPYRLGVKGFAGGHTAAHKYIAYDKAMHVARFALQFAELLGSNHLPDYRPQLFLSQDELDEAQRIWGSAECLRVLISPGAGYDAKCWPLENFVRLTLSLCKEYQDDLSIVLTGSATDQQKGQHIQSAVSTGNLNNMIGKTSLRISAALARTADLVICNSSMMMHCAAAFSIPAVVVLGADIQSAPEHALQWGYGDSESTMLGKSNEHPSIYSADEIMAVVKQKISERRAQNRTS